jgi:hypothetical protein
MSTRILLAFLTTLLLSVPADAQWAPLTEHSIARSAAGKPDLTAPAPRARGGKPDLSGVWMPDAVPLPAETHSVEGDHPFPPQLINAFSHLKPDEVPFQPHAAELFQQRLESSGKASPMAYCKPTGVPWINAIPLPYKIVQTPSLILILYEESTVFRQVFLDGRKPVADAVPRWMGYSTGRWDGDALVVDTALLEEWPARPWPRTEQTRIEERISLTTLSEIPAAESSFVSEEPIDDSVLVDALVVTDPTLYAGPQRRTMYYRRFADSVTLEYDCTEGLWLEELEKNRVSE